MNRSKRRDKAPKQDVASVRREAKKAKFLEAFSRTGYISKACKLAGVPNSTHHGWLRDDEEYAAAFREAREEYIQALEAEVDRRAFRGVKKNRYYREELLETYREYSDILAIFRLKALRPETYRERVEQRVDSEVKVTIEEDPNWYGNASNVEAPASPPKSDRDSE